MRAANMRPVFSILLAAPRLLYRAIGPYWPSYWIVRDAELNRAQLIVFDLPAASTVSW